MSTATQPKKRSRKTDQLTNRQKRFAELYADPNSDTYLNGTRSYMKSGHSQNPNTAKVEASKALTKPNVLSYIEELNSNNQIGVVERSKILADIVTGSRVIPQETVQYDKDGNVVHRTVTQKPVTNDQLLKAIDLANKTEGLYNKANVAEHVAKREYDERMADMRKALTERLRGRGARG